MVTIHKAMPGDPRANQTLNQGLLVLMGLSVGLTASLMTALMATASVAQSDRLPVLEPDGLSRDAVLDAAPDQTLPEMTPSNLAPSDLAPLSELHRPDSDLAEADLSNTRLSEVDRLSDRLAQATPTAQSSDRLPLITPSPSEPDASQRVPIETAPLPNQPVQPTPAPVSPATPGVDPRFPFVRTDDRSFSLPRSSSFPYILGTGDTITLNIFDVPEFSDGEYVIGVDGSINLPWVGSVYLEGQTISSAGTYLEQIYAQFIRDPLIVVALVQPRPLRVSVVGEVTRPGSYTISPEAGATTDLGDGISQWATAINAIQQAGGITQLANIRNIEIRRGQTLPGEESTIEVNLWEFLQTGSLPQDITLRDGDTVLVPRVSDINQEELGEIATANFSPLLINTYVVGEVETPGAIELPPNSSLNQALLAAGGRVSNRAGRVDLIRVNLDGSVERRRVSIDFSDPVNEETNPSLRNNDIVVVRRSTLAGIFDGIEFVTAPIRNVFGLLDGVLDVRDRLDTNDNNDQNNDDDDDDDDDDPFDPDDPDNPDPGEPFPDVGL